MAAKKTVAKKTLTARASKKPRPPAAKKAPTSKQSNHHIAIIHGVEGYCIYLNGYRIVGGKPWGGGRPVAEWEFSEEDMQQAISMKGLLK